MSAARRTKVYLGNRKIIKKNKDIQIVDYSKEYVENKVNEGTLTKFQVVCSVVGLTIITFLVITLIMRYTLISQLNSELSSIERQIEELKAEKDYISMELEPHMATDKIEEKAFKLGMTYPNKENVYVLNENNSNKYLAGNSSNNINE